MVFFVVLLSFAPAAFILFFHQCPRRFLCQDTRKRIWLYLVEFSLSHTQTFTVLIDLWCTYCTMWEALASKERLWHNRGLSTTTLNSRQIYSSWVLHRNATSTKTGDSLHTSGFQTSSQNAPRRLKHALYSLYKPICALFIRLKINLCARKSVRISRHPMLRSIATGCEINFLGY